LIGSSLYVSVSAKTGNDVDLIPSIFLSNRIIDRFRDCLSLLKAKTLSVGGRLTLIKSVLGSLPVYYLFLFKAPMSVLKVLDSIRCIFSGGHKVSERGIKWVKWKSFLLGSDRGGLGVGCLQSKNLSLLEKWKWRFLSEKNFLWCTVIKELYEEDGGFHSHSSSLGCSGVWVDIIKAFKHIESFDSNFKNSFVRKVADGADTSFWLDPWCDDGLRLKDKFLRLYAFEYIKNRKGPCHKQPKYSFQFSKFDCVKPEWLRQMGLSYAASGHFKVNNLTKIIEKNLLGVHSLESHHRWNSWIPKKVNIMVWKASLDRLATCSNLMVRGIVLPTYNCPFCRCAIEDIDHVLVRCQKVCGIWRKVWGWWSLPPPISFPPFSAVEIASGKVNIPGDANLIKATNDVFHITIWAIWNWRNHLIHSIGDDIDSQDGRHFPEYTTDG
nr:reverse transcriptase domain, reverse transcriptase zinc-binding domain protein [Tanacetum cinerariifolium]